MARWRGLGRWVLAAVVLVPVALLVVGYLLFFTDDSPDKLALSDPPPTLPSGSTGSAVALAGTWNVAPGSVAGYRVREKLAALPAQSDAVARTESVTGTVVVRDVGSQLLAEGVNVEVDVSTLTSDPPEDRRDNRIRTMGLESDDFPTATFASTGPVVIPVGTELGQAFTTNLGGQLTIHGVTKDVIIPLDVRIDGTQGEVVGSLKFPFSDFDMEPPNVGGFVSVESDATLEFKLLLTRA